MSTFIITEERGTLYPAPFRCDCWYINSTGEHYLSPQFEFAKTITDKWQLFITILIMS